MNTKRGDKTPRDMLVAFGVDNSTGEQKYLAWIGDRHKDALPDGTLEDLSLYIAHKFLSAHFHVLSLEWYEGRLERTATDRKDFAERPTEQVLAEQIFTFLKPVYECIYGASTNESNT